ncbi:hypothetical protein diail_2778 [Diaporthe ilicicola]|nr:hypothetical protein diail_2778 [Diaporthe ilicicola]
MIQSGCFAANYWMTGKVIIQHGNTWQPQNRMTDTAFHILKLAEYEKLVHELVDTGRVIVQELMHDIHVPWLTLLDRLDPRQTFSWPHFKIEGIIKFRLDDHFWIWKALKSLDSAVTKIRFPSERHNGEVKEILEEYRAWLQHLYSVVPVVNKTTRNDRTPLAISEDEGRDATLKTKDLKSPIRSFMEIAKRLSPNNVQRAVLQRFTTVNDVLKLEKKTI